MRVELAFGKTGLNVELPGGFDYRMLEVKTARPLADQAGALQAALDAPIGSAPIAELARGKKTVAISVCDITRPAPNRRTLPPLLQRLHAAGIPRQGVRICIATGLHRIATDAEIREILGEEVASAGYEIVNHNAKVMAEHRHLGESSTGTPVYVAERFVSADLRITLGFIEPHLMLGFSGGRKLIAPGLAAQETIKVLHSPKFMRDARAVEGSIADNPLHRELLEIARMAGHDFVFDVALTRDRQIAGVFAGHPEQAHARGVEFVGAAMRQELPEKVDAVITTCAGYPLDLTLYQAVKGITAAQHIVKPGGRILICAACDEGPGAAEFTRMIREFPSDARFLEHIAGAPVTVDQWQLEKLALVTQRFQVFFYTPGVARDLWPSLWGPAFGSIDEAVAGVLAGLPPGAKVAVIPEGPYVLARAA